MADSKNEIFDPIAIRSLEVAAALGDLEAVQQLWLSGDTASPKHAEALELAAANGQIDVLVWAREAGQMPDVAVPTLARAAAINGRMNILAYFDAFGILPQDDGRWLASTAAAGDQHAESLLRRLPRLLAGAKATSLFSDHSQRQLAPPDQQAGVVGLVQLFEAIDKEDVPTLRMLLAQTAIPEGQARQLYGHAAETGAVSIVQYLQRAFNIRPKNESDAFRRAASSGHLAVVRYFLINGFDRQQAKEIVGALQSTLHLRELRYLLHSVDAPLVGYLEAGADPIQAASIGDQETIAFLLETNRLRQADAHCAFVTAAESGHLHIVRYLHEHGVTIDVENNAAITRAVTNGHVELARYLFERGGTLETPGPTLEAAYELGHVAVVSFFGNRGVDLISHHRDTLAEMNAELAAADPIYGPAEIWKMLGDANTKQLSYFGLHRFKRSVNQNYLQYTPTSLLDPLLRHVFKHWLRRPSMKPWRGTMPPISYSENSTILIDGVNNKAASARRWQSIQYRALVGLLWNLAEHHDRRGLLDRVHEPRLGEPICVVRDGRLLSQDLANSIIEANSILDQMGSAGKAPLRIAEIGAGYGRLAHVLLSAVDCRYIVIDIPPTLLVSQWYLSRIFPNKTIFSFRRFTRFDLIEAEFSKADIVFLTTNQIALLPDGIVDTCLNISSLHEMTPDQIKTLLGQMGRIATKQIYLKQYRVYENPYDKITLSQDIYRRQCPDGWHLARTQDCPSDPRFFEMFLEKQTGLENTPVPVAGASTTSPTWRPTVSILLCNYNHARYLPTALTAIAEQTRPADEIVIIDDGSTDDSLAVIARFEHRLPNLRLVRLTQNRGLQYAISEALKHATSDYVVWAAADDILLPDFLAQSMERLSRHPQAGICFSQLAVFTDGTDATYRYDGQRPVAPAFDYRPLPEFMSPPRLFDVLKDTYIWISGNSVVANRRLLLRHGGFPAELNWHSDWFGFYALALRYGACVIPATLAMMREVPTSYSREGQRDKTAQSRTLTAILRTISSPKNADIRHFFIKRPTLLSVFGTPLLFIAWRTRHWALAVALSRYYAGRVRSRLAREANSRRPVVQRIGFMAVARCKAAVKFLRARVGRIIRGGT